MFESPVLEVTVIRGQGRKKETKADLQLKQHIALIVELNPSLPDLEDRTGARTEVCN